MRRRKTHNVRRIQWLRYQRYLTGLRNGAYFGGIARPERKHVYEAAWLRRGRRIPAHWWRPLV